MLQLNENDCDDILLILIYLLSAIVLPSGGSSALHIYTQTILRTTQWSRIHNARNNKNT
jgi:hypothetical protein